ncbi:C40 family peptidase [Carboxylicivirga sediminis]|uniref:C40 family peptidase n=1 Tax=Carboxylicivirga sediminis TaxID=2006564 RepID=A0A941F7Y2_9BACT|nr:C40 family peptidase [Carboxylicivirga sediminis]MBR8538267.1 C40 family peptidase [Carboxylicivirga sediminis]
MEKSICTYGFIPVRNEASERSEMVTQLLFGDTFDVLEREGDWCKIQLHDDNYLGWVNAKLVVKLSEKEVERWMNAEKWTVPAPFIRVVSEPDKTTHLLSGGSSVFFNSSDRNSFTIGNKEYYLSGNYNASKPAGSIADNATAFINAPYLWGGRSFYGIDCSGFTQVVLKMAGLQLPRDASQQVELGSIISFVEEAALGDLAFFDNEEGAITHVGICLGKGDIIHASGRVRIDKLDHQGIFNDETRTYTHKLRVIKRIL